MGHPNGYPDLHHQQMLQHQQQLMMQQQQHQETDRKCSIQIRISFNLARTSKEDTE